MKAIGYIRCSTSEQAISGLGMDDQAAKLRAYFTMRDIELVRIISDNGCSGAKLLAARPGGAELCRALQGGEADAVGILKLDRGFRKTTDCLNTVEDWDKRGITLHIIDLGGNAIDTASAAGRFMLTVLAGAAAMERDLTRERTRASAAQLKEHGLRRSRYAPYGQTFERDEVETVRRRARDGNNDIIAFKLIPEPGEQSIISRAQALRRSSMSIRAVAKTLRREGFQGRGGKPITGRMVRAILPPVDF